MNIIVRDIVCVSLLALYILDIIVFCKTNKTAVYAVTFILLYTLPVITVIIGIKMGSLLVLLFAFFMLIIHIICGHL